MSSRSSGLIGEPTRCVCNKLLMTREGDVIIIKCGRCKRYTVIKTEGIASIDVFDLDSAELAEVLGASSGEEG
ncbi:MAG: hypothetical protein R6U70_01940 [Bacillota bacterium]